MKVRDVMTSPAIKIGHNESVAVAARTLAHYNIGVLPVCGANGQICGVVTDRDIVTRCLASDRKAESTRVEDVMTGRVLYARPEMDTEIAAQIMGREQIRRLPVVENGQLCGMVSLGDLANSKENQWAAEALSEITSNISKR